MEKLTKEHEHIVIKLAKAVDVLTKKVEAITTTSAPVAPLPVPASVPQHSYQCNMTLYGERREPDLAVYASELSLLFEVFCRERRIQSVEVQFRG